MTKLVHVDLLDAEIADLRGAYTLPETVLLPNETREVELDLGCGKGSFTTQLARRYPERLILAADVLSGRLRKLVKRDQREGVTNVRALKVEARLLVARLLPDGSLSRIHILCPDPWPKDRHSGNRLLSSDFMARIHGVLKENGIWHFSTDDPDYLAAVRREVARSGLFREDPAQIADVAGLKTDFEEMWLEMGKTVHHHAWVKLPLPAHTIGH